MKDIDKYSLEALKESYTILYKIPLNKNIIRNYERITFGEITKISYKSVSSSGSTIGAAVGIGLTVAAGAAAIVAPFVALPIYIAAIGGAGLAPTAVGIAASEIGATEHVHYFDSKTGKQLSDDSNEAAKAANEMGLSLLENNQMEEASAYFQSAIDVCSQPSQKKSYERNKNIAKCALAARDDFKKGDFLNSYLNNKKALDECGVEKVSQLFRNELGKALEELVKAENGIEIPEKPGKDFYDLAIVLWNKGWDLEDKGEVELAERAFNTTTTLFKKMSCVCPENIIYQNWCKIASLKIKGNRSFNEGVNIQEEANELLQVNKFKEALEKYECAKMKFEEGLKVSGDQRFQSCVDSVEECMTEVNAVVNLDNRVNMSIFSVALYARKFLLLKSH